MKCKLCPKACKADRAVTVGFCGASAEPEVSTICVHQGEEPPLCGKKGICNVFFAHCNLQCIYCQNGDISTLSDPTSALIRYRGVDAIVEGIAQTLKQTENIVGFVTPTHYANHIPAIVEGLHQRGLSPITVYNTGGYESINTLQMLAPYIDIYLPDYKYSDSQIAQRYSNAVDYPEVAQKALKEMYNQKGSSLPTDDNGIAFRGLIVRHLVLPGQVENSVRCLEWIADNLSVNIHVSLMAQYFPPEGTALPDQLNRRLTADEYSQVEEAFYNLGFHRGWVQQLEAADSYRPHFNDKTKFK
jgi:putative pyruvate formate lyase activating enzyme